MNARPGSVGVAAVLAAMLLPCVLPLRAAPDGVLEHSAAFGLPPLALPADLAADRGRVELGRKLFFDRRLSANATMSCAMCHVPEEGFTSRASRTALGIEGKSLQRNAPSLLNVAWQPALFHDGREASLTAQVWLPLLHPEEMGNASIDQVLRRIRALPDYARRFESVFNGAGPSMTTLAAAIAAFEASLVSADSRFDRWRYGGQQAALSDEEQNGFAIFIGKGRCAACHTIGAQHALLADGKYHVTGAGRAITPGRSFVVPLARGVQTVLSDADLAAFGPGPPLDLGRFDVSLDPADRQAFKTPSLRNVSASAPYMHDGSLATLEEVVDFYERGGGDVAGKSPLLLPLGLDGSEKRALIAFLRALDGANLAALSQNSRVVP